MKLRIIISICVAILAALSFGITAHEFGIMARELPAFSSVSICYSFDKLEKLVSFTRFTSILMGITFGVITFVSLSIAAIIKKKRT